MDVAVIGTGSVGGTLGRALARAGQTVTFGSRHPEDDQVAEETLGRVTTVEEALAGADAVILAIPSTAVSDFTMDNSDSVRGKLVIDATNRMGGTTSNGRAELPNTIRYARAFNTTAVENMANPVFEEGRADMFFSSTDEDRTTVEKLIEGVGLRPIFVGVDEEDLVDSLFFLWLDLAIKQGRGRRLAFHLLQG
ncbi:MAG TPA: NAD(P)-binding domain-containing protein [Acidimicrobiales bacterium]|nr:NAD(P)-binding domain-containing protein [Acidimicrobiales bacterium]